MATSPATSADDGAGFAGALLHLLTRVEPLKHLYRTGWVDRDVDLPETVAAHSWRLALMAWLAADAGGLDVGRAMKLALVHDLAEAITGDRTPFDALGTTAAQRRALASDPPDREQWRGDSLRAAKLRAEREAIASLLDGAPAAVAVAIRSAWDEYEAGASAEARLVNQLDKFEALLQGCEYAANGRLNDPTTLNSFRLDVQAVVQDSIPVGLLRALEAWQRRD